MAAPPHSPSSSPRLPSPPPMAEDQTGPQSPTIASTEEHTKPFPHTPDQSASRRIRPGTKASDMAEGPPLVDFAEIDSPFQLAEHLKALHFHYTHPPSSPLLTPITKDTATLLTTPPPSIDRNLWLYELCRFLCQKVNAIIVALFADSPACSAVTCPEMRASEWQYLCAVHDPPKPCCAIDYCCHTLDWAANTLTSPKHFPSRLTLAGDGRDGGGPGAPAAHQVRQLTNIFRRVYRIFAHAWFQHREMFWRVEGRTGLYIFFKTVCDLSYLIPEESYTIPPEAEGKEPAPAPADDIGTTMDPQAAPLFPSGTSPQPPQILRRERDGSDPSSATARRHRQAPSKGSIAVEPVPEEAEEEPDSSAPSQRPVSIVSAPAPIDHAEQPVPSPTSTAFPSIPSPADIISPPPLLHSATSIHVPTSPFTLSQPIGSGADAQPPPPPPPTVESSASTADASEYEDTTPSADASHNGVSYFESPPHATEDEMPPAGVVGINYGPGGRGKGGAMGGDDDPPHALSPMAPLASTGPEPMSTSASAAAPMSTIPPLDDEGSDNAEKSGLLKELETGEENKTASEEPAASTGDDKEAADPQAAGDSVAD